MKTGSASFRSNCREGIPLHARRLAGIDMMLMPIYLHFLPLSTTRNEPRRGADSASPPAIRDTSNARESLTDHTSRNLCQERHRNRCEQKHLSRRSLYKIKDTKVYTNYVRFGINDFTFYYRRSICSDYKVVLILFYNEAVQKELIHSQISVFRSERGYEIITKFL
jgi:hypothetical protein